MAKSQKTIIREAYFSSNGAEITPKGIFEAFYSVLDPLIQYNIDSTLKAHKGSIYQAGQDISHKNRTELYELVSNDIVSHDHGSLSVHFDDNTKKVYTIKPRTNFHPTLHKRPSIAYLESEDGDTRILREARSILDDAAFTPLLNSLAREKFNRQYKGIVVPYRVPTTKNQGRTDVNIVSEAQLILALEQLYAENVANRITPSMQVVETSRDNVWYVRDFLRSARDMPFNLESFLNYQGTLNGLGLMDVLDDQEEHYCFTPKGNVVNIDPDFWTFTTNGHIIDNNDWRSFKYSLNKMKMSGRVPESYARKIRRDVSSKVKDKLGNLTLLDYIPKNIGQAPALRNLAIENALLENVHPHLD